MRKQFNGLDVFYIEPTDILEFQIALVEEPAIEDYFLKFSKEQKYEFNADKQNVLGAVMIPNKPIYKGNPARYVTYDESAIKRCKELFTANGSVFNIAHSDKLVEVEVINSYIDSGGTWMIEAHIDDAELWEMIKSDKFQGFSIEGSFVQFNKEKEEKSMELEEIKQKLDDVIKTLAGLAFTKEPGTDPEPAPTLEPKPNDEVEALKSDVESLRSEIVTANKSNALLVEEVSSLKESLAEMKATVDKIGETVLPAPAPAGKDPNNIFAQYSSK